MSWLGKMIMSSFIIIIIPSSVSCILEERGSLSRKHRGRLKVGLVDVRTLVCRRGMNTLAGSSLNHFQSTVCPLFNNHSAILRQQFTYQCVPSEGDYQQKLDLLQIWWKGAFYKWLIKECIFSVPDMNADAKLSSCPDWDNSAMCKVATRWTKL